MVFRKAKKKEEPVEEIIQQPTANDLVEDSNILDEGMTDEDVKEVKYNLMNTEEYKIFILAERGARIAEILRKLE